MFARLLHWLARLRTWLAVRLGLLRGQWRRGQVEVPQARLFPNALANHAWSYGLYCPRALRDDTPAPLVLLLHGCKQRALGFAQASGFTRAADHHGFRLLCPEQRTRANLWRCWNWFVPAAQRGAGELLVMRAMLDAAAAQVAIAPQGVAVVGLSAGGGLAALLAFHAADRVDAVVTVAAPPLLGRVSSQDPRDVMKRGLAVAPVLALSGNLRPAPLLLVHGRADAVVAPICGEQLAEQALRAHERAGAALQPAAPGAAQAGVAITDHLDPRSGALRLRVAWVDTLGHVWSGAPGGHPYVQTGGEDLTALALRFVDAAVSRRGSDAPRNHA